MTHYTHSLIVHGKALAECISMRLRFSAVSNSLRNPMQQSSAIWCSRCKETKPREGYVKVLSPDRLRYRVLCADCRKYVTL